MSTRIIEISADTLEAAREQLKAQLSEGGRVVSERVVHDGKPVTVKCSAEAVEAAFAKADTEVPKEAEVLQRKELNSHLQEAVTVHAFDEAEARARLASEAGAPIAIKTVRLAAAGSRGVLGIGRRPNRYEIDIIRLAQVEVVHRRKARISATLSEPARISATMSEPCQHVWTRAMSTSGLTLTVVTQCKKCGEIMPPASVSVHNFR